MKKIINLLSKMDKTKRIVILFITISFVSIIGISCYRSINKNQPVEQDIVINDSYKDESLNNDDSSQEEVKKDIEKKEPDQEKQVVEKKDNSQTQKKTENKKQNNNDVKTIHSQEVNKKKETNKKENKEPQEKSDNQTKPPVVVDSIQIKVEGMGQTMMSGKLEIDENSTALSVLKTLAANNNVRILTSGFGSMTYVRGIGDLVEKEHGSGSGWMYKVNGTSPNIAAGGCSLKNGDSVVWYYVYSD